MSGGPLHWFRKNQKIMLVVFGVLLMVVFTVGSMLDNLVGGGGGAKVEIRKVASTSFGSFTNEELDDWAKANQDCVDFTNRLAQLAGADENRIPKAKARPIQPVPLVQTEMRDREILHRMTCAQYAKDRGAFVGNEIVNEYFNLLCNNELANQGISVDEFNRQLERYDLGTIKAHLKTELLAIYGYNLYYTGVVNSPTPLEVIEGHRRFNEKVEIEYLTYDINDYLEKATDKPSKDEIKRLYEEGKDKEPNFAMGPGFKTPRMATIGYFHGKVKSFDEFLNEEKKKITEAQIQTQYNKWLETDDREVIDSSLTKNGGAFVPNMTIQDDNTAPGTNDSKSDAPGKDPGENKSAKDALPKKSDDDSKKSDSAKKTPGLSSPQNTKTTPAPEKKGDAKQKQPAKGKSDPAKDDKGSDPPKTNDSKAPEKQSNRLKSSAFQFVSLQEKKNESAEPAKQDSKAEPKNTEQKKSEPTKTTQDPKKKTEATAPKPESKQDTSKKKSDDAKAGNQEDENKPKYLPLDEKMRDKIRKLLANDPAEAARKKAQEAIAASFEEVETEVINYLSDYDEFLKLPEEFPEPDKPDFASIAKKYGLEYSEHPSISYDELEKTDIGKSNVVRSEQGGARTVVDYVFYEKFNTGSSQATYRSKSPDESQEFLFWAYERIHAEMVSLSDAEDAIIKYYQKTKALELMKKDAQKIVDKIQDESKLLSAEFGDKVSRSESFSWFEANQMWEIMQNPQFRMQAQRFNPGPPGSIGSIRPKGESDEKLEGVDNDFMAEVFKLDLNEVGFAVNAEKKKLVVFQVVKKEQQTDEQEKKLFNEISHRRSSIIAQQSQTQSVVDLRDAILKQYKVTWFGEPKND